MKSFGIVVLSALAFVACGGNDISATTSGTTGGNNGNIGSGGGSSGGSTTGGGSAGSTSGGTQTPDAGGPPAATCKGGDSCAAFSSVYGAQVTTPYPNNTCSTYFLDLGSTVADVTLGIGCENLTGANPRYCHLKNVDMTFLHCSGYKYALIDLSAVWCAPCNAEALELPSHTDAWRAAGGVVFSVLVEGTIKSSPPSIPTQTELLAWWTQYGTNYPMAIDPTQIMELAAASSGSVGLPTNVIVDLATMKVIYSASGFASGGGDATFAKMDQLLGL